jgi:hypothetical protein
MAGSGAAAPALSAGRRWRDDFPCFESIFTGRQIWRVIPSSFFGPEP